MRMMQAPIGLPIVSFEELEGPKSIGSSTSNTSYSQNVLDPFGPWVFEVTFDDMSGGMARAFQRWRTAFLAGTNCSRLTFKDISEPTYEELGIDAPYPPLIPWSNGLGWSNGSYWELGKPLCNVVRSSDLDSSVITVDISNWNGVVPAWFGIVGHFAVYKIMEADIAGDTARLNVWPPVRKAITTADYATLRPVIAAKATVTQGRMKGRSYKDGSLTVTEVLQETVDNYVTEGF